MNGHLEITTRIGCRLACSFCPQKTLVTNYESDEKVFTVENFTKVISTVPTSIDIHFSGFAEPFLNPDTPKMMNIAHEKGHKIHLYSTMVGITEEGADILKNVNPQIIRIHVADPNAMKIVDDKWLESHEIFYNTGLKGSYMAMGHVSEKVKNYLDSKGIIYEIPTMLSRGGNLHINKMHINGPIGCAMDRWHQNVVLPDGNVYICCMDYGLTMPAGNLLDDDYRSIWNKAEEYKNNHNPPENSICRSCEWAHRR